MTIVRSRSGGNVIVTVLLHLVGTRDWDWRRWNGAAWRKGQ